MIASVFNSFPIRWLRSLLGDVTTKIDGFVPSRRSLIIGALLGVAASAFALLKLDAFVKSAPPTTVTTCELPAPTIEEMSDAMDAMMQSMMEFESSPVTDHVIMVSVEHRDTVMEFLDYEESRFSE